MRSSDFLLQLKKALENELSAAQVQDNVEYYKNYIKEEMKSGKSEQEVMDMLGDPWAIAKTILLEEKMSGPQESINSEEGMPFIIYASKILKRARTLLRIPISR